MLPRVFLWVTAVTVSVLGTMVVALKTMRGPANFAESLCSAAGRIPPDVNGAQVAQLVGPITYRCQYPGHPDLLITTWTPLLGLVGVAVATMAAIALVCWTAYRLDAERQTVQLKDSAATS